VADPKSPRIRNRHLAIISLRAARNAARLREMSTIDDSSKAGA
jgi:hypothetical protein